MYRWTNNPVEVAGYFGRELTPLNTATPIPLIVDEGIANLEPGDFWLSGGSSSLMWNVMWDDFSDVFEPIVAQICHPE